MSSDEVPVRNMTYVAIADCSVIDQAGEPIRDSLGVPFLPVIGQSFPGGFTIKSTTRNPDGSFTVEVDNG